MPTLRGLPRPEDDNGTDVVMVSGFFGTKEDFRELLSLLAEAGFRGWAYDYLGQLGPVRRTSSTPSRTWPRICGRAPRGRAGRPAHLVGHCLGGFVARAAAVREPALARSLTLMACGPSMRDRKHKAMLSGLAQLHANGGAIALWPLVKALLAEDDTIMREFWHAKLVRHEPALGDRHGRIDGGRAGPQRRAAAAGIPSLVVHGKRDRRLWSADAYGEMARRLGPARDDRAGVAQPQHGAARGRWRRPCWSSGAPAAATGSSWRRRYEHARRGPGHRGGSAADLPAS